MAQGCEAARPKAAVGEPFTEFGEIDIDPAMIEQEHGGGIDVLGQGYDKKHYDTDVDNRRYTGDKHSYHYYDTGDEHRYYYYAGDHGSHYYARDKHRFDVRNNRYYARDDDRLNAGEKQHLFGAGDEHSVDVGDDTRYYAGEKFRDTFGDEILSDEIDNPNTQAKQSPLAVAGIMAASVAVTGLAGGGTASLAAAFGLFALLLAGLSLVVVHARRA